MAAKSLRHASIEPAHPGVFLRDIVIPGTGRTKTEISALLGISRQTLHDILSGRQGVSPVVAVRLAKMFGNEAAAWMQMQTAHDLWKAERVVDVSGIPVLTVA